MGRFNTVFFLTSQWLLEEEEQEEEEEERMDHVFPLLTSPLRHVHTWFSLECCFCGIADGKQASGFIWGEKVYMFTPHSLSKVILCVFLHLLSRQWWKIARCGHRIKDSLSVVSQVTAAWVSKLKPEENAFIFQQCQQSCLKRRVSCRCQEAKKISLNNFCL